MNAATTARTNTQSAAIALLAANSAKPAAQAPRDDSFADALSSANQSNQKREAGIFAARQEPTPSKPKSKPAADTEPANAETKPALDKSDGAQSAQTKSADSKHAAKVAEAREPDNTAAAPNATPNASAATPASTESPAPQLAATELPTEAPLMPLETATIDPATANVETKPLKNDRATAKSTQSVASTSTAPTAEAATDLAATTSAAVGESDEAINPAANATKRAPTDPLRLIQPNDQSATSSESSSISTATSAAKPIGSTSTETPVAPRSNINNTSDNRNVSTPTPQAFGITQPGKVVPQSPVGGTSTPGNTIGGTATSNTSTTAIGSPRLDPSSVPTRLPGGRTPETPISLKLTSRPLANGAPGTPQTEADAAATQIARGLTSAFRNKVGQLTLWMNPESLGKLRVQMTIDNGSISARFEATSEATKNLLTQNIDALRGALESRGLTASSIEVVSIPDWSKPQDQSNGSGTKPENNNGSPPQRDMNQNSSGQNFGQNDNTRDNMPPKLSWLRDPEVAAPAPHASADPIPQIHVNERLLAMSARLEIDAVA